MTKHCSFIIYLIASFILAASVDAHIDGKESVHDILASIKQRLLEQKTHEEMVNLKLHALLDFITPDERQALGRNMMQFNVNAPITLYVITDAVLQDDPFWLKERGFIKTELTVDVDNDPFAVWIKDFEPGLIELGITAFQEPEGSYFLAIKTHAPGVELKIDNIYPGQCRVGEFQIGAVPYVDDDGDEIDGAPEELIGLPIVRTMNKWAQLCQLIDAFRMTRFPAVNKPDQIILTWSDNPQTTQTIQWRTSTAIKEGVVMYAKKADFNRFYPKAPTLVKAKTNALETPDIINDPIIHRHTAVLTGLEPDTAYVYSVGDGSDEGWSELAEFSTAPVEIRPFTFIYMGDAQNGLDRWGSLLKNAYRERPDAAFYIMAGDLINRGNERWDWDDFFFNSKGVYERRQLVPAIGNHEAQGHPTLYLEMFDLLKNGPDQVEPERAYWFEYSNALFVILDTNFDIAAQTDWLDATLAASDATWKFVVYHHPAYSSAPNRDNADVRSEWTPLFDKYAVDMALQGHDHAYLRTYPMKNGVRVSEDEGVVYIVSVSGVKMYEQADRDYTAFGMTNVSTYQVLDIHIIGDRLLYRAYDIDGNLKDEIELKK